VRQPAHGQTSEGNIAEAALRDLPHVAALTFSLRGRSVETARTSPIAAACSDKGSLRIPFDPQEIDLRLSANMYH